MTDPTWSQPYLDRRVRLMEQIGDGLILVRGAAPTGSSANFRYLSGVDDPSAALLLAPTGIRVPTSRAQPGRDYLHGRMAQQILFLPRHDALAARWGEESRFTTDGVQPAQFGVDLVLPAPQLPETLGRCLSRVRKLHYVRAIPPAIGAERENGDGEFVARIRRLFFDLLIQDVTPAVEEMRRIKSREELQAIEAAIALTARALRRAVARIRPGVREYEIEAAITEVYRGDGGVHAFDPIIASGGNALKLHYRENRAAVGAGELLLIDSGVSLDGYSSDISRTFPTGGRFGERQRELYEQTLLAQRAAIERCVPGALLGDVHAAAYDSLARSGLGESFVHGIGHHLGLETHDVGDIHRPLEPGAVITVEPGVYLPEESVGIRIEDDILITDDGCRVLSDGIPKSIEAIEAWMAGCVDE